jgi:hypothetical protein
MSSRTINKNNNNDVDNEEKEKSIKAKKNKPIIYESDPSDNYRMGSCCFFFMFVIFIVAITIFLYNATHHKEKKALGLTGIGGSLINSSQQIFIQLEDLESIQTLMQTLTASCTPSPSHFDYSLLQVPATIERSTAGWNALQQYLLPTCDFYGLTDVQVRTGEVLTPLAICDAYFTIMLEVVSIYYDDNLPAEFYAYVLAGIPVTYPLILFWDASSLTQYDIAGQLMAQVNQFIIDGRIPGNVRNPSLYAQRFCNPYFALGQPTFYVSTFQPWLAFPFEGVLTRTTNNYFPYNLQLLLDQVQNSTVEDILNPANSSVPTIKNIFAIGNSYLVNPATQLFVESYLQNKSVIIVDQSLSVTDALQFVQNQIVFGSSTATAPIVNTSDVPVLVIARYADNPGAYNGYIVPSVGSIYFIFTDDNPDGTLDTNLSSVAQTVVSLSSSRTAVGILDVIETSEEEDGFGEVYSNEKDVADAISSMLGTLLSANTQQTQGILLETFAIKNTIVNGVDLGGRLTKQQTLQAMSAAGASFGLKPNAFSMELHQAIVQSPNDTLYFGVSATTTVVIPNSFNLFTLFPSCIPATVNQGQCENCWAIGSSSALSFNLCANHGVPIGSGLSIQHITGCAQTVNNNGCSPQAPQTMYTFGIGDIHSTLCMPQIPTGTNAIGCPTSCQLNNNGLLSVVNGIVAGSATVLTGDATIKQYMVQNNAAVATALTIASDFLNVFPLNTPSDAIYNPSSIAEPILGGHMVWIIGFVDDVPVPYWLIKNSWGPSQGENGVLKIAQNIAAYVNHTMWIESNTYVATPRVGSINPPQPIEVVPGNASTLVTPTAKVYTNPYSCQNLVLNQQQNLNATATQNCPSNTVATKKTKKTAANEKHATHVHPKNDGGISSMKLTTSLKSLIGFLFLLLSFIQL